MMGPTVSESFCFGFFFCLFVFLPVMEVFKCQILTLVFLNFSELLKGLCGSNSLVPRAIGLPY